jgi:hypothetical protein
VTVLSIECRLHPIVNSLHVSSVQLWDTAYLLEDDDEEQEVGGRQAEAGPQAMEEDAEGPSMQPAVSGDRKGKAKVDEVAENDSDEDSDGEWLENRRFEKEVGWCPLLTQ